MEMAGSSCQAARHALLSVSEHGKDQRVREGQSCPPSARWSEIVWRTTVDGNVLGCMPCCLGSGCEAALRGSSLRDSTCVCGEAHAGPDGVSGAA